MIEQAQPKPELTRDEAAYLVGKLDQPIECTGHQDRNNLQVVVAKLVQIANYVEPKDVKTDDTGKGGKGS